MSRRRRRRRQENSSSEGRAWRSPGVLNTILIAFIAGTVAGFLLGDTFDRLFNWPVLYVWVTGSLIAYILQLIGLSRFMLPPSARHYRTDDALLDGSPATREGMYLLMFYAFIIRLFPERLRRLMGLHLTTVPPGVDDSFTRYQAGMVDSHLALVLARGTSVTRAAGPGYVRLERFERILQAVDLRTQFRAQNASVTTRDGIPLTTVATAMFQVRAGRPVEEDQPDTLPYPYEDSTVFRLAYADSAGEEEVIHWSERLCPQIEGILVGEISKYAMDELYRPAGANSENNPVPIVTIAGELISHLQPRLRNTFEFELPEEQPITLFDADFANLNPPKDVLKQRVSSWQADWQRRSEVQKAEAEHEAIRTLQAARARAQLEAITDMTEMIEAIYQASEVDLSEVIVLRTVEALERIIEANPAGDDQFQIDRDVREQLNDLLDRQQGQG